MRRQLQRLALENAFINVNQPPSHEDALIMSFRKEFGHLYPTPPVVIEHNPIGRPYLAMEEIANGQPVNEIEHTIYARVVNFSDLEQAASKELQEQWEIRIEKTDKIAGKGSMRVRKTWNQGKEEEATYVRTSKVVMNEKGDKIELPLPSNKDEFTIFKFLSAQGMRKDRFTFPIIGTNLKWEIDMFPKADGSGYHEWCKIDLEVQNREQPIPEFPIALEDVILPEGYGRSGGPEVQNQITQLYDDFFLMKNPFLPRGEAAPAVGSASAGDQGIATAVPALPNDTAEPTQAKSSPSDEPPAPAVQDIAPLPQASSAQNPQQQLDQALNQGLPDNLQVQAAPDVQEPVTAELPQQAQAEEPAQVDSTVTQTPAPNETPVEAPVQPEADGAQPDGTQPDQPGVDQPSDAPDDLATKPQAATEPAAGDAPSAEPTPEEQQAQQEEQTQEQTQDKVDAIQQEKKAEAESQGKLDPTEDGKVPVDLIDNPAGDPSMMKPEDQDNPEGAGEETANGGNVTGATDGTDPDSNGLGTGDGLGGELADGAGTTGTDDAMDLTSADATDPASEEGTVPSSTSGTAEGNNGDGEDIDQANGEQAAVANAPSKAAADEIPPENDPDKRKLEAEQQ